MRIPRLRILRTWDRAESNYTGYWLLLIEPRWPLVRFFSHEELNTLRELLPTKEDDTLDVIIEHFDQTKTSGDCMGTIWATDLFGIMFWYTVQK